MEHLLDDDLPEEIKGEMLADHEQKMARIEALAQVITRHRDEAVQGRADSGIEAEWIEDEESYQGIDDSNRSGGKMVKATTMSGGTTRSGAAKTGTRSTVFMNITRPYVDGASAKVSDMLLPTDDRSWGIQPTPKPELVLAKEDMSPVVGPNNAPLMRQPNEQEQAAAPEGEQAQPQPMTVADVARAQIDKASEAAKGAEMQIDDWLTECQFHSEVRKAIEDCARLGTGILKGPYPSKRKGMAVTNMNGQIALEIKIDLVPETCRIDPWNLYPDPSCGENIHNGNFIVEKDRLTRKKLEDLRGTPGYLSHQIDEVLKQGPQTESNSDNREHIDEDLRNDKNLFTIWHYYGSISKEDLIAADCNLHGKNDDSVYAIISMINNKVIKAAINPLDTGEFPYDMMPWQRRTNKPWGSGVSRQMRTPQGILNAGVRNMMDNAAASGGPMVAVRQSAITPADGSWEMGARKLWYVNEGSTEDIKSVQDAIWAFNIPSMQNELMNIINFAMKMAEDVTGLPMLMQGQQGSAPDTVGGMQMLSNNASTVLRRIARTFDDYITEPHIRRYYEYLLMYGDDDSIKGDFTIDARGSSALVERDIQNQFLGQVLSGGLANDPEFGIDKKKLFSEVLKSQHLDPKRIQLTEDEMDKKAQAQPAPPIQLAVAETRAKADITVAGIREGLVGADGQPLAAGGAAAPSAPASAPNSQAEVMSARIQMAREEQAFKADQAQLDRAHEERMKQMDHESAMLKYAEQNKLTLEQVKAKLADTAMKLNTQKELTALGHSVDLHKEKNRKTKEPVIPQVSEPVVEPPQRAEPGSAYEQ